MKFLFIQRILPWLPHINRKEINQKGTITLVSVFLFFLFSTLGMGMIHLSQIYLKLSAYKKNSILLDYASENGIKKSLNHMLNSLSEVSPLLILSEEEATDLKEDAQNKGLEIIEKLLESDLPLILSENWENLHWESTTSFSLARLQEKNQYFQAIYEAEILSEGTIQNFNQQRKSSLKASLGILAGRVPLPTVPLLIDKKMDSEQKKNYLKTNKIDLLPSDKNCLPPKVTFSEERLISQDANPQISKALKIEIFHPQTLSTPKLREALGLEVTNEPIPDGVYLIKDDLGLGGLFVQGDVDELIMAIEEEFQIVSCLTENGHWLLKFSPTRMETIFISPEKTEVYELVPIGIIIINGKIFSLGGGIVDSSGNVTSGKDGDFPCILRGVNLTIISSDKITLSSHLIHQGVKWIEGVPYIKDSNSQLNITSTGKDFVLNTAKEGKIAIDKDSPNDLKIQASLTAPDEGISIEGEGKTVHLLGSLHGSDYTNNRNLLKIMCDDRFMRLENLLQNAPVTSKPVLYLSFFRGEEWKEY